MTLASLISVIVVLAIIGLAVYLVETYIPMSPPFQMVIRVVVVICLLLWLLSQFGLSHGLALR